jgi:hypothetical protein
LIWRRFLWRLSRNERGGADVSVSTRETQDALIFSAAASSLMVAKRPDSSIRRQRNARATALMSVMSWRRSSASTPGVTIAFRPPRGFTRSGITTVRVCVASFMPPTSRPRALARRARAPGCRAHPAAAAPRRRPARTSTRSTSSQTIRAFSAGKSSSHSGSIRSSASSTACSVTSVAVARAARQVPTTISGWRSSARTWAMTAASISPPGRRAIAGRSVAPPFSTAWLT